METTAIIEKDIFPGVMTPPFHYACFTRFRGFSEDRGFSVHNSFQIMLGLSGVLHFELEKERRQLIHRPGEIFVLGPGIRHRWHSEPGGFCENFMFMCNGFEDKDSELGRFFNVKRPYLIWHFPMEAAAYAFHMENFRSLILEHDCCAGDIMHGLLLSFCGMICRRAVREAGAEMAPGASHPALERALELIHRDYRGQLTLERLSRHSGLGPSRLSELFRDSLGMSPLQYVNELKVRKAAQLLAHSDMNVSQVAEYLGFSSVHYFSRFFKSRTGRTPGTRPPDSAKNP